MGNVGVAPDVQYTASGTPVVNFSLATNERWKDSEGNQQERTTWHRLYMFGSRAETIGKYVNKGDKLLVQGKIRNESYEKDGVTFYTSKVEITDFEFVTSRNGEEGNAKPASQPAQAKGASRPNKPATKPSGRVPAKPVAADAGESDDDLPF